MFKCRREQTLNTFEYLLYLLYLKYPYAYDTNKHLTHYVYLNLCLVIEAVRKSEDCCLLLALS